MVATAQVSVLCKRYWQQMELEHCLQDKYHVKAKYFGL